MLEKKIPLCQFGLSSKFKQLSIVLGDPILTIIYL